MREDNAGAAFLEKNMAVGQRTKHIDTRCHYVRELVERKVLQVIYIWTKNNFADLMTKNLGYGNFKKFTTAIVNGEFSLMREGGCQDEVLSGKEGTDLTKYHEVPQGKEGTDLEKYCEAPQGKEGTDLEKIGDERLDWRKTQQ